MKKKEILLNPVIRRMDGIMEPPVTETITFEDMTMDEANQHLSQSDKQKWVEAHNKTAHLYFINKCGWIQEVPAAGWWY